MSYGCVMLAVPSPPVRDSATSNVDKLGWLIPNGLPNVANSNILLANILLAFGHLLTRRQWVTQAAVQLLLPACVAGPASTYHKARNTCQQKISSGLFLYQRTIFEHVQISSILTAQPCNSHQPKEAAGASCVLSYQELLSEVPTALLCGAVLELVLPECVSA